MADCYWYGNNPYNYSPGECKEDIDNIKLYTIGLTGDIVSNCDSVKSLVTSKTSDIRTDLKNQNWTYFSFFRLQLKILYQVLCFLAHLSRNFASRIDTYDVVLNSSKLHIKFDFNSLNYIGYYMGNDAGLLLSEIIPCTEDDDYCGGRIITDTFSTDSSTSSFQFCFEFEVFCPFFDFTKFFASLRWFKCISKYILSIYGTVLHIDGLLSFLSAKILGLKMAEKVNEVLSEREVI